MNDEFLVKIESSSRPSKNSNWNVGNETLVQRGNSQESDSGKKKKKIDDGNYSPTQTSPNWADQSESFPVHLGSGWTGRCSTKQPVNQGGCWGWVVGWTQSARCEISADVAVTAHGAASLFIFQETGSERGRNSCESGFSVAGIKWSLTQLILPEELAKEM